ncbi:Cupin domain-containing protein [Mucilaginibacter gossypiicola]|uniref:Cupin domain-containing protein n=1 Tax=Mucilaginibacter gossypiicola TaxID=551995 RepID=A0A1H8D615_9SPHI|nr:cupin domain-containing protein [Mucilaginibacter gossypiicola]SEN02642.1 Cupin domain-containing protein [Mucilaginibacter gossypiicola]
MTADEQKLHDYLDTVNVHQGDPAMQDMVINSFYNQCEMDNDDEWEEKIAFARQHFDIFCGYIKEVWLAGEDEGDALNSTVENDFDIPGISTENLKVIDLFSEAATTQAYKNLPVALTNDHVVRLAVMTEPYFWHLHPDSDECFLVLEGTLIIEMENDTVELTPNQLFNIPRNVIHRTLPKGERVVNLTFESGYTTTVKIDR